jgi:hypothetical protein
VPYRPNFQHFLGGKNFQIFRYKNLTRSQSSLSRCGDKSRVRRATPVILRRISLAIVLLTVLAPKSNPILSFSSCNVCAIPMCAPRFPCLFQITRVASSFFHLLLTIFACLFPCIAGVCHNTYSTCLITLIGPTHPFFI